MLNQVFEALASEPRRKILAFLSAQELTAGEISGKFEMSPPAISRHLSILEAAGLVRSEKRGQFVFYRLVEENLLNTLTSFAFEVCPTAGPLKREGKKAARKRRET